MNFRKSFVVFLVMVMAVPGGAWGPHREITTQAVSVQDPNGPLATYLGPQFQRLSSFGSMGDWYNRILAEPDGSVYFSNDYLTNANQPTLSAHTCPGVNTYWERHFRRAVQAIRTETPLNALRWIGTLMHFTEDPGAPCHALPGMGALHHNMENWVKREKVLIPGYQPMLLGATEDEALAGYLKRMDGLVAYSKPRGEKVKPLVENNNQSASEPIILECALESARVTADLLFTLGAVSFVPVEGGCGIQGVVNPMRPNEPGVPCAKIVLLGTNYSTLADPNGYFEFRNLPAGRYEGRVLKPGYGAGRFVVDLEPGKLRTMNITLPNANPTGNMVMNGDFSVRWTTPTRPDGWYPRKDGLESFLIPVKEGKKYRIAVNWVQGKSSVIVVRWYNRMAASAAYFIRDQEINVDDKGFVLKTPEKAVAMHMLVKTTEPIWTVCENISMQAVR